MNKIANIGRIPDEDFIAEELACDFCVQTRSSQDTTNNFAAEIPPCHRCVGLIYAMKSKAYFIIS